MNEWKRGSTADLVAACEAMAWRAREARTERNRLAQLDARNAEPELEVEPDPDEVAAQVIDLDRWTAARRTS